MSNYKPESPNVYNGGQHIIVTDRIIFNARKDSIFLFANKSIGLSSKGSINMDSTKETIINSPEIYLGLNSTEPLVLGNKLKDILNEIASLLSLKSTFAVTAAGVPSILSPDVITKAEAIKLKLNTILSKQNKTL